MNSKIIHSRRSFLQMAGIAGAGTSLIGFTLPFNKLQVQGTSDAWKIFMFSKHLQFLDYHETAETMKEAGLDGADLTVRPGGHVLPENIEADLPKAVNAFDKAGMKIGMMTTRITDPDDSYTKPILKTAADAGIKYYRMGYLRYDEDLGIEQSIHKHQKQVSELAEMNSKYGIHGAYQNHSGRRIGGPVWDVWMLIKDLNPEWIGCQYDIRHAVVEGGYSWPLAIKLLEKHIKTVVIKDFKWIKTQDRGWRAVSVPLGEGMVDFDEYFTLLKQLNIQAPVSLHFEYPLYEGDNLSKAGKRAKAIKTIQQDVEKLKTMLKRNGLT